MPTSQSIFSVKTGTDLQTSGGRKRKQSNGVEPTELTSLAPLPDIARRFDTPNRLPSNDILQLQRIMGNQAVAKLLSRKAAPGAGTVGLEGGSAPAEIERGIARARGGGHALGKHVQTQMEQGIGADFSAVRIHTGADADQLNRSVQARAFTTGKDIFFKKDAYNPQSGDGRKLLAHELTHVVQQGSAPQVQRAPNVQRKLTVGPAKDQYEKEAGQIANSVMRMPSTGQHESQHTVQRAGKGVIQRNVFSKMKAKRQRDKTLKSQGHKVVGFRERVRDELGDKSTSVVGDEDKRSVRSRDEAAKTLDLPISDRVTGIEGVIAKEKNPTNAFKRVAFLIEGRVVGNLETAFNHMTGKDLREIITKNFTNRPHKYSAEYLLSILDNRGRAPLKSRLLLTLGLVDSPAVDEERLLQLAEGAKFDKFQPVWNTLKLEIQKRVEPKTFTRLEAYVDTQAKSSQIESKKLGGLTVTTTDRNALAAARDKHLASIILFRRNELSSKAKVGLKAMSMLTFIPVLAPLAPVPKIISAIAKSVDSQELSRDILNWRKSVDQEDVVYIRTKGAVSEFEKALAMLPKAGLSNLRGITENEVAYLKNLATADIGPGGDPAGKENKLKASSVYHALQRDKNQKSSGIKGKVAKKARGTMGAGKWDEVSAQILSMSAEQREELLNHFPGTTRVDKMNAFTLELKAAGIGEDKSGPIIATFDNTYDEAGKAYLNLVDYVTKETNVKSKLGKLKRGVTSPTKSGKADKFGGKVIKLLAELRGNEFAQVRQNQTLLQTIEQNSGKKWFAIMRLLGITSATDQLTGTKEQVIEQAQQKAEQTPEYWATQIEYLAMKTKDPFDYRAAPTTPGKNGKIPTKKPVDIDKIKLEEISWLVIRAQSVAQQVEENTNSNPDAAGFMLNIYNTLQPETQAKLKKNADKSQAKDAKKAEKFEKVYLALTDHAKHPLDAKDAIKGTLKKAQTKWYKRLWRPHPDRVRIVNSFSKLEGKELLDEWSNFSQYKGLSEGADSIQTHMLAVQTKINTKKNSIANEQDPTKLKHGKAELDILYNQMIQATAMSEGIQRNLKGFVLGIRPDRYQELLDMTGLQSEDRLKIVAMLTEKIIETAESDTDVQMEMLMVDMPFDEWMKAKMRGVDAIEMQRYLDGSRQWHLFSNKGAQLDEGTRRVVGTIRSGSEEMREGENQNKGVEELQAIKSKYSKRAGKELTDRKEVEAAFKDMQAKFNARASLIVKIVTTLLITAITAAISAATYGAAAPIMLAINAGLLLSQVAVHAAFDYFVLKKPISQVAVEAGIAILKAALTLFAANLSTALNVSFLHPDLFMKGTEWLAPGLSKALSKTVVGIMMAYPKSVLKMAYDQAPLEAVVEKGKEKTMGVTLLKNLAMGAGKPWLGFALKGAVGGVMQGVEHLKTPVHQGLYGTPPSTDGPSTPTTQMPTGQDVLNNPGGSIGQTFESGKQSVDSSIKNFLTPTTPVPTPQGDFATTLFAPETSVDSTDKMIGKQSKKLKKEAKKGAVGKGGKGGWLVADGNMSQNRSEQLSGNRDRIVKGMKLVTGGRATKLTTGVTPLTTDVHVVFFGGGWRLEDTGAPKTAMLNGQQLTGAMLLSPGDIVAVAGTRYDVELGA